MSTTFTGNTRHKITPFCKRATVPAGEYSPWVPVNDGSTVVVKPTGGTAKVQATCSPIDVVAGDNATQVTDGSGGAIPFDWVSGAVAVTTAEQVGKVTAIRFVGLTGSVIGEVAT
jgi:hypothetical protein